MGNKGELSAVSAALKKKYGPNVFGSGEKIALTDKRVTSGSFFLDLCLGGCIDAGFGLMLGRVHAMWGDKSGGKTTTAYRIAGLFMRLCRNCWRPAKNVVAVPPTEKELKEDPEARWSATGECDCYAKGLMDHDFIIPPKETNEKAKDYADRINKLREDMKKNSYEECVVTFVDAEDSFDKRYFSNFGDPRRLLLVRPAVGEDACDLAQGLALSGQVDLMILDSLAHFMPKGEDETSAHEWQQGLQARIVNKTVRKMVGASAKVQHDQRRLTQIWINQTRVNIGMSFGDPSIKPAGMGQEFAAHAEIRFRGSKVDNTVEKWGSDKETLATMVSERFNFEVSKNKIGGTKKRTGFYKQTPSGEVLEDDVLFKMAMKWLVKENKKGKDGKYTLGDLSFKTQKAIQEAIQENPDVRDAIRTALLVRCVPLSDQGVKYHDKLAEVVDG